MNRVNEIVICRNNFDSEGAFKNAVRDAIMVLLDNDYIMTVRYDEKGLGIVAIEYNYGDKSFGDYYPHWLLPEEYESITWSGEDEK